MYIIQDLRRLHRTSPCGRRDVRPGARLGSILYIIQRDHIITYSHFTVTLYIIQQFYIQLYSVAFWSKTEEENSAWGGNEGGIVREENLGRPRKKTRKKTSSVFLRRRPRKKTRPGEATKGGIVRGGMVNLRCSHRLENIKQKRLLQISRSAQIRFTPIHYYV